MKAAILENIGAPLTVANIDLGPDLLLERGQVFVRVLCTGICGSQLQEIDGIKGKPEHLPHLLGHEGCGIVERIGLGVTTVKRGDKVVMHWRKGEGIEAEPAMHGKIKAGPIATFSEFAIVSENRITPISDDIPNDFAALLGCALSTAMSIVENEARPKIGNEVCVIGCGGIGLSLIFALTCKARGLWGVTGIDSSKTKRELVSRVGDRFTRFIWTNGLDRVSLFDIVIDTIGDRWLASDLSETGEKIISLQPGGTSAGGFEPSKDIPRYCEMFRHGTFSNYESIITHRIGLDKINDGIKLMRDGKAGRVMIEFNGQARAN